MKIFPVLLSLAQVNLAGGREPDARSGAVPSFAKEVWRADYSTDSRLPRVPSTTLYVARELRLRPRTLSGRYADRNIRGLCQSDLAAFAFAFTASKCALAWSLHVF